MSRYIGKYVSTCNICLQTKSIRQLPSGELHPLPILDAPWDTASVDFIMELPESAGGKVYLMILVDGGTPYKYGVYQSDKSDATTILAFEIFHAKAETVAGRKLCRLRTDCAFESAAWEKYCQSHGITHEFMAPYSSAQNGLAEHTIRTTMDDVHTLLHDSNLGHSYWAEAAAYSIDMCNLIPSHRHPGIIPTEAFSGKRQNVSYLQVFGTKCWPKYLLPMETRSSILRVLSVVCSVMPWEVGTTKSKISYLVGFLFHGMSCLKKGSLIIHQQV